MMYTILINQGCSGAVDNYAMIKLMNNEVIELNNDIAKVNCESGERSKSVYLLSKDIFNKLKVNKIKSIRFNQSKTYADYNILIPDILIKKIELLDTK